MASVARCMRAAAAATTTTTTARRSTSIISPATSYRAAASLSLQRPFSSTPLLHDRKYTKDHEWISVAADRKSGVMGISEYAAEALGEVVYVELPQISEPDSWVGQGDAVGAVESVKSAADINAPLRLRVTHINSLLEEKPATVNQVPEDDSHGGGWIARVELDDESMRGWDGLMTPEQYKEFTSEQH